MYRNVYGGDVHIYDTRDISFAEVGHRDIAAVKKRQTFVVVLKIDRLAHPLGILIYKAEYAVVCAASLFVYKIRFKIAAELLVFVFESCTPIMLNVSLVLLISDEFL